VPEPWATRLVQEGGGHVLLDEAKLWPQGKYVTTDLIVSTKFLDAHPDVVRQLIEGELAAIDLINSKPAEAQKLTADAIDAATGKPIKADLVAASFKSLTFTVDPIASSLLKDAKDAKALGFLSSSDVKGIYDLKILNEVLKSKGQPAVSSGGAG
jgi:NitT/TauT family transport system substrate-binding protein